MTDTSCREYVRDYCKADLSNEKADLGCVAMTTNTAQLTLVCDFDDVPENSPCNQQEEQGMFGLTQSSERAFEYYTLASDQGDAEAQTNLGVMYATGDGVETSYSKARELWTKAAALKQLDQPMKPLQPVVLHLKSRPVNPQVVLLKQVDQPMRSLQPVVLHLKNQPVVPPVVPPGIIIISGS